MANEPMRLLFCVALSVQTSQVMRRTAAWRQHLLLCLIDTSEVPLNKAVSVHLQVQVAIFDHNQTFGETVSPPVVEEPSTGGKHLQRVDGHFLNTNDPTVLQPCGCDGHDRHAPVLTKDPIRNVINKGLINAGFGCTVIVVLRSQVGSRSIEPSDLGAVAIFKVDVASL